MKPITNILLLLTLVCYVFLPLFEISFVGNVSGLEFTASMITSKLGLRYTIYPLIPFITVFLAVGFNCLKNRWWGILVVFLIFIAIYFFATLTSMFQGFSLMHDPEVVADTEMGEGMPILGVGIGFYASAIFLVLSLISALVSLMPFKFNKRIEETIDSHIGKGFESSRKHISKVGHGIHDELHKIGKHSTHEKEVKTEDSNTNQNNTEPAQSQPIVNLKDDSRFMPQQSHDDDERYMPKS